MARVTVYPRYRWDITEATDVLGNTYCTREYFERHKDQNALWDKGVEVDSSQLDGNGCIPVDKLPKTT